MFCILEKEKMYPAYVSKNNSNSEKNYSFNDSKWKGTHYCELMYFRTFKICFLKNMSLTLQNFFRFKND